MTYEIIRGAPEVAQLTGGNVFKTEERKAMERLRSGDAFVVTEYQAMLRARWARRNLTPKKFTVRKMADGSGWQVRRFQ